MKSLLFRCQSPVISGPEDDNLGMCNLCLYTFCKKCYETFHFQTICPKDYIIQQAKLRHEKELERLRQERERALSEANKTAKHKRFSQQQDIAAQRYRHIIIKLSEQDALLQDILTAERNKLQGIQYCPNCHVAVEKDGGCSHMFCTRCQYHFTWETLEEPTASAVTHYLENEYNTTLESFKDEVNKFAYIG